MSSITEQISVAAQTTLASPIAVMNALSKTAFGSLEKLITLNINTVKQSLENSSAATQQLFSASKPQELLTLSATQTQPHIEKIMAYGRELADITIVARGEILQAFTPAVATASKAVSTKTAAPVAIKAVEKVSSKPAIKSDSAAKPATKPATNTQLPLLAEAEVKPVKAVKQIAAKPAKPSDVKAIEVNTVSAKPSKKPEAKSVTKVTPETSAADVKPVATPVEAKASPTPAPAVKHAAKPTVEAAVEKKSAVKMPFPASPAKQANKPSFPAVSTRPAYKAKGSAATGAKKPVRQ